MERIVERICSLSLALCLLGCDVEEPGGSDDVFGRSYVITIVEADGLPFTNGAGEVWDMMPGFEYPDPFVCLVRDDNSWECCTRDAQNTLTPNWNEECEALTINVGDLFWWAIYDADVVGEEVIYETPDGSEFTLTFDQVWAGSFSLQANGITVQFSIAVQ